MPQRKIAWITGASGGIGAEVARNLAATGTDIVVGYGQGEERAHQVMRDCQAQGVQAIALQTDVRQKTSIIQAYEQICTQLGAPNIFIHAAGIAQFGLFQDVTAEQFDEMMDTHVRGALTIAQSILSAMLQEQWGRILFISSIWGETGGAGEVLYSAAKGAQISMAKAMAKELAPSGITVNVVSPGAIQTPMLTRQLNGEEQVSLYEEIPVGRVGTVQEVASAVRYLCSSEASYVTGHVLRVNGGWYM